MNATNAAARTVLARPAAFSARVAAASASVDEIFETLSRAYTTAACVQRNASKKPAGA